MTEVSSFSYGRHPHLKALAALLARSMHSRVQRERIHSDDIGWSASTLLVETLLNAKPRRPHLDRMCAATILADGGAQVTLDSLEARSWVRIVLGRLEIPGAVRHEIRKVVINSTVSTAQTETFRVIPRSDRIELTEDEKVALKLLDAAHQDGTAPFWIPKDTMVRIHNAHKMAHRRTPSLDAIARTHTIVDAHAAESYDLPLRQWSDNGLWGPMSTQVLGLYWQELGHDTSFASDDERLEHWLRVATEMQQQLQAPEHMTKEMRERFLDATLRRIVAESDLLGSDKEIERIRWEHDGFGFNGAPTLTPLELNKDLLSIYRWWQHPYFGHIEHRCRRQLNTLISMLIHYDSGSHSHRISDLLNSAIERPYLMHEATLLLSWSGREAIAGLVANIKTSAIGMQMLSELKLEEDPSTGEQDFASREMRKEALKTEIWREAVALLLGTLYETSTEQISEKATTLSEILLLSAKATLSRDHRPHVEEQHQKGAEERFLVLLAEVHRTERHLLFQFMPDIHTFIKKHAQVKHLAHPEAENMPNTEMRILLWMLRRVLTSPNRTNIDPMTIAETVLSLYRSELLRMVTPNKLDLVVWWNDAIAASSLPWQDLAIYLYHQNKAASFIEPDGVEFYANLHSVPVVAQNLNEANPEHTEYSLYRTWLRKTRLHVRILIAVHERLQQRAFDPILNLNLTTEQRASLLEAVEDRIQHIILTCATKHDLSRHPSLFELDDEFYAREGHHNPYFAESIVKSFNRFSTTKRDTAFASWIAGERNPTVILTIIDMASPLKARELATSKLSTLNVPQILENTRWFAHIEKVAEAANAAGRIEVVEKVLNYGDQRLKNGARFPEWEMFAYRMRLMVAYHRKNLDELNLIPLPANADAQRIIMDGHTIDPARDAKSFYNGLLILEDDPEQARRIFDNLLKKRPGSASDALNRSAASLAIANKIAPSDDRLQAFLAVLHEWDAIEPSIPPRALTSIRNNVIYLRLACFNGAELDDNFDAMWAQTNIEQRIQAEFLTLAVENARRRGLNERVAEYLDEARPYHVKPDGKIGEIFEALEHNVKAGTIALSATEPVIEVLKSDAETLRRGYLELYHASADITAQIVGGNSTRLHEYLKDSLQEVAREFVLRNALFIPFKDEDKYNDVLVSLLRMRLGLLGWQVVDQTRGGHSQTQVDVGERDWVIRDRNGEIAICEALRLNSVEKTEIDKHIEKSVFQYNPSGIPYIYMIIYYEGRTWQDFWGKYVKHIRESRLRGLLPEPIDESDAPASVSNVRVALLIYKQPEYRIFVYHIGINLSGP